MSAMWWIGVAVAATASLLAHAILTRALPGANAVVLFLAGGLMIGSALVAWAGSVLGIISIAFVAVTLTYAAWCELYVFLCTLALSSVSANILVRVAGASVDTGDLAVSYSSQDMVEQRLARMQAAGLIAGNADGFRLTRRGAIVVGAYRLLRAVFRHT